MNIDLSALPEDVDALHRLIGVLAAERETEQSRLREAQAEIERLKLVIHRLTRHQFGRHSERLSADQLALGLEDLDADIARVEAKRPTTPKPYAALLNSMPSKEASAVAPPKNVVKSVSSTLDR